MIKKLMSFKTEDDDIKYNNVSLGAIKKVYSSKSFFIILITLIIFKVTLKNLQIKKSRCAVFVPLSPTHDDM